MLTPKHNTELSLPNCRTGYNSIFSHSFGNAFYVDMNLPLLTIITCIVLNTFEYDKI